MKAMSLVFVFLSFPALACPKLAGVYKACQTRSGESSAPAQVEISQKVVKKITHYTIKTVDLTGESLEENFKADGKPSVVSETDEDTGVTIKNEVVASCKDDLLKIKMVSSFDGEVFAKINVEVSKSGNKLTQIYTGESLGEAINDTIVCE